MSERDYKTTSSMLFANGLFRVAFEDGEVMEGRCTENVYDLILSLDHKICSLESEPHVSTIAALTARVAGLEAALKEQRGWHTKNQKIHPPQMIEWTWHEAQIEKIDAALSSR